MKKELWIALGCVSSIVGIASADVLTLAGGATSVSSTGNHLTVGIEAQTGDLNWDIGETVVLSYDFGVTNPTWINNAVGWAVGIGDGTEGVGFGTRYSSGSTAYWNANTDATAGTGGVLSINVANASDRTLLGANIEATSADLRSNGESAHFVFTAKRDTATQYTLNAKWYNAAQSTFEEITYVRDDGNAVDTFTSLLVKISPLDTASTTDVYTLSNVTMTVIPEPATLGMVGLVGIGLIAVRRFMI